MCGLFLLYVLLIKFVHGNVDVSNEIYKESALKASQIDLTTTINSNVPSTSLSASDSQAATRGNGESASEATTSAVGGIASTATISVVTAAVSQTRASSTAASESSATTAAKDESAASRATTSKNGVSASRTTASGYGTPASEATTSAISESASTNTSSPMPTIHTTSSTKSKPTTTRGRGKTTLYPVRPTFDSQMFHEGYNVELLKGEYMRAEPKHWGCRVKAFSGALLNTTKGIFPLSSAKSFHLPAGQIVYAPFDGEVHFEKQCFVFLSSKDKGLSKVKYSKKADETSKGQYKEEYEKLIEREKMENMTIDFTGVTRMTNTAMLVALVIVMAIVSPYLACLIGLIVCSVCSCMVAAKEKKEEEEERV